MKDNFSSVASLYATFRPTYPSDVIDFILQQVSDKQTALDCATGNGQVAAMLADTFNQVYATDISAKQIEHATKKDNIIYLVQAAEKTDFTRAQFDLITVGQAIHWFDFDAFYTEVNRILKPGGVLAVIGYALVQSTGELNELINYLYKEVLGEYWDKERKYIDKLYQTIPFPFNKIDCPSFTISYNWSFEQFIGYLRTWSAVNHYKNINNSDPIEPLLNDFMQAFSTGKQQFSFPILLRVGRKH